MTLPELLTWYRSEWNAETPGRIHVRLTDAGGTPEWHERFRSLINGDLRGFPLRYQLRSMARRGSRSQARARFLYVLACQGFDVKRTASALAPGNDHYARAWAASYATFALRQLYDMAHDPERTHEDGTARTFVEKRISKSEAQAAAEAA
jgi:hypothetical protein